MILEEGLTKLIIPGEELPKGPGKKRAGFYNPDQILNRDITISLLSALKPKNYLDGFGGTGIRGIRVSKETGVHPVITDINKRSIEVIKENVSLNNADVEIYNEPFESVASRYLFDFIDVDPYGSIVPFLDVALTHVKNGGYLGLTATDLSALTGSAPRKTRRRYSASILNDRLKHESGIRLLIAYVANRAAALDRSIMPVASFWKSHYYRIVVQVKHGAGLADRMLEEIRMFNRSEISNRIYGDSSEGPLWIGQLNDVKILEEALQQVLPGIKSHTYDVMNTLRHEDEMLFFYELSDFATNMGRSLPKVSDLCEQIQENYGIPAYRTHFSSTGIKSRLPGEEFYELFNRFSKI